MAWVTQSRSLSWGGLHVGDMVVFERTGEWCILLGLDIYESSRVGHVSQIATNWSYEDDQAVWTVKWGYNSSTQSSLLDHGLINNDNLVNGNTLKKIFDTRGSRDGNVVTISGVVYGSVYTRQI